MKVYAVVGAKKNGNTDKITQQFVQGALSAGHEVEVDNEEAWNGICGASDHIFFSTVHRDCE